MENEKIKLPNNNPGRGRIVEDPQQMQYLIDKYFESRKPGLQYDNEGKVVVDGKGNPVLKMNPPSITGLALWLGYACKDSIADGIKRNDGFSAILKEAKTRCENFLEEGIISDEVSVNGATRLIQFYGGWAEKKEIEAKVSTGEKRLIDLMDAEDVDRLKKELE
jgi:hypothetical protein